MPVHRASLRAPVEIPQRPDGMGKRLLEVENLETEAAREEILLEGDIPSPLRVPGGCRFHPRCPKRIGPVCVEQSPAALRIAERPEVACRLHREAGVGAVAVR